MNIPYFLLRLLPMWDFVCPKCKKEVDKHSQRCPYCGERYGVPLRVPPKVLKDPKALEDYVHQNIFPKVSASQREYLTQWFTEIYSDGFEDDLSGWNFIVGSPTISTDYAHHGEKSLKCTTTGNYVKKSISNYTTIFERVYVRFEAFPTTDYVQNRILTFWNAASAYAGAGFYHGGTGAPFQIMGYAYVGGSEVMYYYTPDPPLENSHWYCLEVKYVVSPTVGELKVWFDGDLVIDQTGLNTGTVVINRISTGIMWSSGNWGNTYVDCFVAADAYIGEEDGAILKEVTDSLSLGVALLCNKTFAVTDSVGLVDASLKHWTPQILDSLGLSDTILRGKQFSVSDSISLSELITVITEIIKQVTDSVSLSDGVSLNKALLLADQIGLTDNVYVNKILIISDDMALAEVVEKSVQGVVKPKVFLIIGDLAIQLTGD